MVNMFCRALRLSLGALLVLVSNSGWTAESPDENLVKAAFLYNFAQFVDWPEGVLDTPDSPVSLCVFGPKQVDAAFLSLGGKTVKGRKLIIRFLNNHDPIEQCQVLFISDSERVPLDHVFDLAARDHILTVSDQNDFARFGGVIGLVKRRNKIRFEINLEAARLAQLKISSRLLNLAQIVRQ